MKEMITRRNPDDSLSPHQRSIMHERPQQGATHLTIEEARAIVRNANRLPQVDEVWLTRDGKNKVLVASKDTRSLFGRIIKGSYASPVAQLCFEHDGAYSEMGGNHGMDLVTYITTI